jgi:hypothetical protein
LTHALGVLRKGVEEGIEDLTKCMADMTPVLRSEAIQRVIQEWTDCATAVDAVATTGQPTT